MLRSELIWENIGFRQTWRKKMSDGYFLEMWINIEYVVEFKSWNRPWVLDCVNDIKVTFLPFPYAVKQLNNIVIIDYCGKKAHWACEVKL